VFWQDVATYTEYVNLELSIHRSMENHEVVGVQINGIKGLLGIK
jgi:hypothetical protein